MMLAKVLAGTNNTEAVLTIKERTKSVPFAEYLWLDSTYLWKAAGREKLLMLALAETIPARPISCYSWLGNLLARLLSRVLLRQIPGRHGGQERTYLSV